MDKYLGFKYKDKSLGMESNNDYTGFILNEGSDLQFVNTPEFSNNIIAPDFSSRTYYTGISKGSRELSFTIMLDEITFEDYKDFLYWLNMDDSGDLSFDYNPNYSYEVKVSGISPGEFNPINNTGKYYVEIDLDFTTINDWAAKWTKEDAYWNSENTHQLINNDKDEPFLTYTSTSETDTDTFEFNNVHRTENYFEIDFNGELTIIDNDVGGDENISETYKFNSDNLDATFYSEYGIAIDSDGNFLASTADDGNGISKSRVIPIPPKSKKTLEIGATTELSEIRPISREII